MKKILVLMSLVVISMFLIGCGEGSSKVVNVEEVPEGLPTPPEAPAGSAEAIAGQGVSTGTFDYEYQFYNMLYNNGKTIVYFVDGGWDYLGYLSNGDIVNRGDLTITVLDVEDDSSAPKGSKLKIESTCADFEVQMNGAGNYEVARAGVTDSFNVPLSRYNAVNNRPLAGSEDAITVHSASSGVGWFTLKCDEAVALPPSLCGNGDLDTGEECDDGNTVDGDNCAADCTSEFSCDASGRVVGFQATCQGPTGYINVSCVGGRPLHVSHYCEEMNGPGSICSDPYLCSRVDCSDPSIDCASRCQDDDGGNFPEVTGHAQGFDNPNSRSSNWLSGPDSRCYSRNNNYTVEYFCDNGRLRYASHRCADQCHPDGDRCA